MSLRERLASGGFAVTAEISPPRGAATAKITIFSRNPILAL